MRKRVISLAFILLSLYGGQVSASDRESAQNELRKSIVANLEKVPEFKFIREEATHLGIKGAWLFGGTAAGFAHYVRWDSVRIKGATQYQKERFDYDYTNIYRANQDLDIVIDGTPDQAAALQAALVAKFPHMQGSKTAWEVRLLNAQTGDKLALLNNPDFLNQHTDSNSTGMIELTDTSGDLHRIRDLRDWESVKPHFLEDITEGKIHFYFSDLHPSTSRFKSGMNPPILSVIRALTKAFQYDLAISPEN